MASRYSVKDMSLAYKILGKDLTPEEARAIFQKALEIVAEQIGTSLPYAININGPETKISRLLKKEVHYFLAQQIIKNPDLLDEIYTNLIPQQYRRHYGQFLTPHKIAKFMRCKKLTVVSSILLWN